MNRLTVIAGIALIAGCGGSSDKPAADASTPAAAAAPAPINLADVAGTWTVKSMAEGSDSVLVTSTLKATAADTGWTLMLPDRKPQPAKIVVSGDSIIMDVGPYESVLRKGVTVSTHGVSRVVNGQMVGTTIAHYSKGPDSVRTLRTVGTKAP